MSILTTAYSKLIGAGAIILALVSAYFGIKRQGAKQKETEIKAASVEKTLERAAEAKEVEHEIDKMSESDVNAGLKRFVRDD